MADETIDNYIGKETYALHITADIVQDFNPELFLSERIRTELLEAIIKAEKGAFVNVNLNSIEAIVCDYFKLPFSELKLKSRERPIVKCRQVSMYFYKEEDSLSGQAIGDLLGKKSQATVLCAVKKVKDLMFSDKKYAQNISELDKRIKLFYERKKIKDGL